jgi:hypothetical protein
LVWLVGAARLTRVGSRSETQLRLSAATPAVPLWLVAWLSATMPGQAVERWPPPAEWQAAPALSMVEGRQSSPAATEKGEWRLSSSAHPQVVRQ